MNQTTANKFQSLAAPWVALTLDECDNDLQDNPAVQVPLVARSEVSVDCQIGQGSFSTVYRAELNGKTFAMKILSADRVNSEEALAIAATDLGYEAQLLAKLDHENIIQLYGVSDQGLAQSYTEGEGYFLLLDLLEETLTERMARWRHQHGRVGPRLLNKYRRSSLSAQKVSLQERVKVALDVAKAMDYLRSEGIVLRDLKPQNIGFDAKGNVKLFDLGLARPEKQSFEDEIAGSYRYMAPENAVCQPSGLASDVYSFGVLLWEIVSLQRPYENQLSKKNRGTFLEKVILGQWRHSVSNIACSATRQLIRDCWAHDSDARPSFDQVLARMTAISISQSHSTQGRSNPKRSTSLSLLRRKSSKLLFRAFSVSNGKPIFKNGKSSRNPFQGRAESEDTACSSTHCTLVRQVIEVAESK